MRSTFVASLFLTLFGCVSAEYDSRKDGAQSGSNDSGYADSRFGDSGFRDANYAESGMNEGCSQNSDCTNGTASACVNHQCTGCGGHADCAHISGNNVCFNPGASTGSCVPCTPEVESACGEFSCIPLTHTCSITRRRSVGTCQPCLADSECSVDSRCIAMQYQGLEVGSYCLPLSSTGCSRPLTYLITRTSMSGYPAAEYCALNEDAATCGALLGVGRTCLTADDCGLDGLSDGACGSYSPSNPLTSCSIFCGSDPRCPTGYRCESFICTAN